MTSSFSEIKVLFFIWQKISRKTEFICMRYFLKTCANQQNNAFYVKTSRYTKKISSILQKMKIGLKKQYMPFYMKAFNLC